MSDPLTDVVTLLQPTARFSKLVEGAGNWRVDREGDGDPFYCAILKGECYFTINELPSVRVQAGDFMLIPAVHDFATTSSSSTSDVFSTARVKIGESHFRVGTETGQAEFCMQVGHCSFGYHDTKLILSLLPEQILVRGELRLTRLVEMVAEESLSQRPARSIVLERLLELLLIEALRCGTSMTSIPSLVRGLTDERLATALKVIHEAPEYPWTVERLSQEVALSRSAFFARFNKKIGIPPMQYLHFWRMALAKKLLSEQKLTVEQIAGKVGYGSLSAFSVAFSRSMGVPPSHYGKQKPLNHA